MKVDLLVNIPNRWKRICHVLQQYLYLACVRDRSTHRAVVTYKRIIETLGISRNEVSRANSTLVSYDLITVRKADNDNGNVCSTIAYWLRWQDPIKLRIKASNRVKAITELVGIST